ncbi:hypothetical protein RRG08_026053 [Elysia crispata]|uniref:Uncharacterized protein n=1 Tax=Elysia crispata TaxID=231223 RepID=A0AAE0YZ82_9GAST|nr:hypothetical protein RRG08_026053 [Elysia crispata]
MQRPSAKRAIKENTSERARHYRQLPLLVAVFAGGSIRAVHLRKSRGLKTMGLSIWGTLLTTPDKTGHMTIQLAPVPDRTFGRFLIFYWTSSREDAFWHHHLRQFGFEETIQPTINPNLASPFKVIRV